jgi:CheY-like chemotaxis protein
MLGQVLGNLLVNAQQALGEVAGERRIRVETRARGDRVEIEVADSGPGIPPALRERIFEPYFTTKPAGVGTGIGLAISRNVAMGHGGDLRLEDGPGARFVLALPAAPREAAPDPAQPAAAAGTPLSVLVVDDERDVGESLGEMLRDRGHRVTVLDSGAAALAHLEAHPVHAVFADLRMPGIDGAALAHRIADAHPGLARRVVIVTGDGVHGPARLAASGLSPVLLEKPFTPAEVARALEALALA